MKSPSRTKLSFFVLAGLLAVPLVAWAYLPKNCDEARAKQDFKQADIVLIGRVVKLEREVSPPAKPGGSSVVRYVATLKAGRVFLPKGAPVGGEYQVEIGSYSQRTVDETTPTSLQTHNTHPSYPLAIDGVYLVALDKVQAGGQPRWAPRSCHGSVHRLEQGVLEGPGAGAQVVLLQRGLAFRREKKADEDEHYELQEFLDLHSLEQR